MKEVIANIRQMTKQRNDLNYELQKSFKSLMVNSDTTVVIATQLLLSHRGRVVEAVADAGCCGVASLHTHLEQCADPTSWVHASLQNWIRLGIENPEQSKK